MSEDTSTIGILLKLTGEKEVSAGLAKLEKMVGSYGDASRRAGHASVSSMQASSAALRALHGGFENNIRAGERFLSMLPGVGTALKAAFPLIGVTAVAGAIFEAGKKLYDLAKAADEAGDKLAAAWRKLGVASDTTNDALAITNDKLEQQIALIEGTPVNNLQIQLDIARKSADSLASSLGGAYDKMQSLMETNHVGAIAGFWTGKAVTSTAEGSINSYNQKLQNLGYQYQEQMHSGDTTGAAKTQKEIQDTQNSAIQWSNQQLAIGARRQRLNKLTLGATMDYSAAISDVSGFKHQIESEQYHAQLLKKNQEDKDRLQKDKQIEADKKKAAEEAKKAAEEAKKASEEQKRAAKALLEASDRFARMIPSYHMEANGRLSPRTIVGKYNASVAKSNAADDDELFRQSRILPMWVELRNSQNQKVVQQSGYKSADMAAKFARELAAAHVDTALKTGQISPLQANLAYQQGDAAQFKAEIQNLVNQLSQINSLSSGLSLSDKAAQSSKINNEIQKLQGEYAKQSYLDAQAVQASTAIGEFTIAMRTMAQQVTDLGNVLANASNQILGGFNQSIVSGITGQGFHGHQFGIGVASTWANAGLNYAEGSVIKSALNPNSSGPLGKLFSHFGLGGKSKPTGTSSDPLFVSMVGGKTPAGLVSSLTGGHFSLSSLLGKVSGTAGGIFSSITKMLGFASGGAVSPHTPIVVGEHGREIFTPGAAGGYITPHHQSVAAMSGKGHSTIYNINAQGANAADVEMRVHRAIKQAHAEAVTNAVQANRDMRSRTPHGSGW